MIINKDILNRYAKEKGVKFIVLFGSHSNGRVRDESDLDIAVFLNNQPVFSDFNGFSGILNNLAISLGVDAGRIDVVDLNSANILLRYEITSKGKLLYGDKDEYEQFRAFAFRDYLDAKSLFDLEGFLIAKKQELIGEKILSKKQ